MEHKKIFSAILSALICPYLGHCQSDLKMPGPPAQKLMLGTWSIHVQYAPTEEFPKGDVGVGEEKWYPGPGGLSLVEEYREKNSKGEIVGLGVVWWDERVKGCRVLWCENTNPSGCEMLKGLAKWKGQQFVLDVDEQVGGKRNRFEEVFSDITLHSFKQTLSTNESGSYLKPFAAISATKKDF